MLVFDDGTTGDTNREHVMERLGQVSLPAGLTPQMGADWSPVGQIYWYTLESTNPAYDVMEKKSLEDWTLEKSFKSVPGVVDVSSFGGPTKEYQIKLDPEKLVSYGLSISQIEQQITNNNTNGGGSFIEQGAQQINVQSVGLFTSVQDIENTVVKNQNGAPIKVKDIATVAQGPKIRLGLSHNITRLFQLKSNIASATRTAIFPCVFCAKARMIQGEGCAGLDSSRCYISRYIAEVSDAGP